MFGYTQLYLRADLRLDSVQDRVIYHEYKNVRLAKQPEKENEIVRGKISLYDPVIRNYRDQTVNLRVYAFNKDFISVDIVGA